MVKLTSSKGTQEKWIEQGYYYKRDFFGGEAEAEYLVSEFLKACGQSDVVMYEKVADDCCRAKDFVPSGAKFLTMFRYLQNLGYSEMAIEQIVKQDAEKQLRFLIDNLVQGGVGYEEVERSFARMFEIDKLSLNVDRHWNNFGIVFPENGHPYLLTLFDFGYSLGVTFPSTTPNHVIIRKSKAATVAKSFNKQCQLLQSFHFTIPKSFLDFLEKRESREAKLFLNRIKRYYSHLL